MKLKSFNSLTLALITFFSAAAGARAQSLSITNEAPVTYTNQFILFAGASPTFSVWASDTVPFGYQWVTNGALDGAATTNVLQMTNVQVGSFSNYCIVTDSSGSVTSSVWTASVIADPTNGYPQAVLADNPVGYWRMDDVNEDGGDNGNGDDGYICHDYIGGNDGIYTNVSLGNSDYNPVTDPSDTSAEFGETGISFYDSLAGWIQNVDFASSTTTNFTIEAWVNGYAGSEATGAAILSKGVYSLNDSMVFDCNSTASEHYFRFYVRGANGTVYQATSKKKADGSWHHLVGVCDETAGELYFYIDGSLAASGTVLTTAGLYEPNYPMSIGAVQNTTETTNYGLQFYGYINDVAAYNYALSAAQVSAQFSAAGSPPLIEQQPVATTNADSGGKLVVPTVVNGTAPLGYQWYNSYNDIMPGQTNAALTISDIMVSTNCYLTITNGFGSTNTTSVTVNVVSGAPQIYANITPTNWAAYVGGSVTFSVTAYGTAPLYYQWFTNNVLDGAATNSSVTALAALGTNYYYSVVSNAFDGGSVTGSISAPLIGVSAPTNPYSKRVLDNDPLAYWPLDETNGNIANDYVGGHDALYTNVQLGVPDFSTAYPDTATQFGLLTPTNSYAGEIDNSAIGIPNIDFSTENTAEFSVEAWVNAAVSQISGAALVAKGYSGNEQFDMDVESGYFRFLVRDNVNVTYTCTSTISPGNVWHHVVGVCDEINGLVHLYVDGVDVSDKDIQAGKSVIAASGAADPAANLVSIGARSASESAATLNDQLNGILSHVAIYGFALSSNQIAADYEAGLASGINANPTNIVTSVSGNLLTLSWPMDHTGWQLQSQTNSLTTGIGTNWANVSGSTTTNAVVIPINVTNGSVFYRLMYDQ